MVGEERIFTVSSRSVNYVESFDISHIGMALINPNLRIVKLMQQYESALVNHIKFTFVPTVSKTASGSIHLAPDYDVCDLLPSPEDAPAVMSAMAKYKTGPISENLSVDMPNPRLRDGSCYRPAFYLAPQGAERNTSFGRFMMYAEGSSVTGAVGHIVMKYDIDFIAPQISSSIPIYSITADGMKVGTESINNYAGATGHSFTSDGPLFLADSAVPFKVSPVKIVTAILDQVAAAEAMTDFSGQHLPLGSRIFMKVDSTAYESTPDYTRPLFESATIAGVFTSILGEIASRVSVEGASGAQLHFRDTKTIGF